MSDSQDRGKAPSVPPSSADAPPTDDIDSEWGSTPDAAAPPSAPKPNVSLTPETRRSEPGPSPSSPPGSSRPPAPAMPDLKRGRTLIGIAVPTPSTVPTQSTPPNQSATPSPQLARSRTLIGIAAPIPGRAIEPRGSDEAPATQPSESPIAAAVQGFLEDKPATPSEPPQASPSKPAPAEAKPATLASQSPVSSAPPASSKAPSDPSPAPSAGSRDKVITLAEPLSKRAKAQSQPPPSEVPDTAAELEAPESRRSSGSIWVVLLIAAGLAGAGFWLMSSAEKAPEPAAEQAKVEPALPAPAEPNPPAEPPEPQAASAAVTGTPAPSAEPVAPAASASAPAPAASAEPPSAEMRRVIVTAKPAEAKFYRNGKQVSGSPMTVDLPPGEKRAFEVGLRGYVTRKVVVDGTKPEITVGLRPEAPAGTGAPAEN